MGTPRDELQDLNAGRQRPKLPGKRGKLARHNWIAPHHYHFKIYALDKQVSTPPGADKKTLMAEIRDHVLAEGELVGTYQR
jgi:phosphatidylethanolamine-binding protein (PEBP) family uncharacterized protein